MTFEEKKNVENVALYRRYKSGFSVYLSINHKDKEDSEILRR